MDIKRGWLHSSLAKHHMSLTSMMCLVVKEMKHSDGCRVRACLTQAVGVGERPGEKIAVYVVEERFYPSIFFSPRGAEFGEGLEQDSIQRGCRLAASGKPGHPDAVTQQDMVQQGMDTAKGSLSLGAILGEVELATLLVESLVGDSVVTSKQFESFEHV